jgi:hypothetical protein
MSRSARSANVTMIKDYTPSDLHSYPQTLFRLLEELKVANENQVVWNGLVGAPTTPSTQAAGVGNTVWNANVAAVIAAVSGAIGEIAATADVSIHAGSLLTGLTVGKACVAAIVIKLVTGTLSLVAVKGTPATLGAQVGPDDAAIQAAVGGAGVPWISLGETTISRSADTVLDQTYSNIRRPVLGVTAGMQIDL